MHTRPDKKRSIADLPDYHVITPAREGVWVVIGGVIIGIAMNTCDFKTVVLRTIQLVRQFRSRFWLSRCVAFLGTTLEAPT